VLFITKGSAAFDPNVTVIANAYVYYMHKPIHACY